MKKGTIMIAICTTVLLITSCKKEICEKETGESKFAAAGYWRGYVLNLNSAILNREDGSSRIYLQIPGADTANAVIAWDRHFTVPGGLFKATYLKGTDTIFVDTTTATPNSMSGALILYNSGAAYVFDLRKQP